MSQSEAALTHARPIALCEPRIQGNEIHYLEKCIRENWVSSAGPYVDAFERSLAELAGSKHAVSTSSGTAAIHLGLLLAGIQPDEEVIVPSLTFIAPANAVRYLGAWPTFLDVEPRYWQIDPAAVERFLREDCQRSSDGCLRNRHTGRVVRCLLAVHLLGHPCEMDSLLSLCAEFGLFLLEDATESLGARYRESPVGSHGQLACFSFNGNKIVTTGGGGMLVTNDDHLAERARYLSTQAKDDPLEYVHNEVGYNYRLTSLQAAFGLAQLEQLEG
ncbi:aminotransferase class I/II-fold pyridoxal phosphate-dependent enzyme, partial [bacterium CPR1]|nr:aminotransferase class I/II-fold pyridoxal phosphate-dependent enzyme [bacterium CPR1]